MGFITIRPRLGNASSDRALSYTASDLDPFAADCGWSGPPFRWDDDRRFLLRCELDAAFFHLYLPADDDGGWRLDRCSDGCSRDETPAQLTELQRRFPTPRDAVAYILATFPIVRRKDEEKHSEYRTTRVVLEIYDAMQESLATGNSYQTRLCPPPADGLCCHPLPEKMGGLHLFSTNSRTLSLDRKNVGLRRELRRKTLANRRRRVSDGYQGTLRISFCHWENLLPGSHQVQVYLIVSIVRIYSQHPVHGSDRILIQILFLFDHLSRRFAPEHHVENLELVGPCRQLSRPDLAIENDFASSIKFSPVLQALPPKI